MGRRRIGDLTKEQKQLGVELRRQVIPYLEIAEIMGLDVDFLKYRLMQHLKVTHPELLNSKKGIKRNSKKIAKKVLTCDDVYRYHHNEPLKIVNNLAGEVKVTVDKTKVDRILAELGVSEQKVEQRKTVFNLGGIILGTKHGKTVFEATFGGGQY